ncbi:MAG: hypothetical protein ACOYNL_00100 [Rickettsiales bacterium]
MRRSMLTLLGACAAMMMCSGCANTSTTAAKDSPLQHQQIAAIDWDTITAPSSAVTRSNAFLIMMR